MVRGLAKAIIRALKANNRITNKSGLSFGNSDTDPLNPFKELIFNIGFSSFFLKKYQMPAKGKSRNNQKNSGFTKVILVII
jgi:hypothetical protein